MVKQLLGLTATACLAFAPLAAADGPAAPMTGIPTAPPAPAPSEASEIARLQALPPSRIPLRSATLASAIELLAQAAKMSYVAPPEGDFDQKISSDVTMNPYELLRMFADSYGVGMQYRQGVWWFYKVDLNQLVTKAYTIHFNNLEEVSIQTTSINNQLASAGGGMASGMTGGGSMGGPSGGGMRAGGGGSSPFSTKPDKIIDDIKKIIGLPTVGTGTPSLDGSSAEPAMDLGGKPLEAPAVQPIWNPDTSQLFVVATRQQHSLIAAYLKTVDRPQKLIRIAVKFVETARDPKSQVGVDWANTVFGNAGPLSLSGAKNVGYDATTGLTTWTTDPGNPLSALTKLSHLRDTTLGLSLISAPAFQWTMQAIASDSRSSVVQDPILYTSNNREVTFTSTTQEPIQEGTTTIGSATAATTSSIAYIDVGTQMNVLPIVLPGRGEGRQLVQLNLSINVSAIVGQQSIGGNEYPVTTSRTYSYSVAVPVGETLAIAGLEQRSRQTTDSKVPIFGDIPILGYAFKNRNDSLIRTTLIAFITPELIDTDQTNGPEGAAFAADEVPAFRHRIFQGSPTETLSQVDQSLKGLPEDIEALQHCATASNKEVVLNRLQQISVELALMDVRLGELRQSNRLTGRESKQVDRDRRMVDAAKVAVAELGVSNPS